MTRSLSASWWRRFAAIMLPVVATAVVVGGQGAGSGRDVSPQPRSSGVLAQARDGSLLVGSGARIHQEPGLIDKVGSFLVGLGYGAPGFDRDGLPDKSFGSGGAIRSVPGRRIATAAGLAIDEAGAPTVAALSSDGIFLVRYTAAGPVDLSFRSTVTARP